MTPPADAAPFGLAWRHPLFAYQQAGIARLAQGSLLLADDMGLGKTIQAIGALRVLAGEAVPALLVAPAGLVRQWRRQLRDWAPELRPSTVVGTADERMQAWRRGADIYLTSYDSLRADILLADPAGPRRRDWAVVIADEAQRMKNASTATALAIKRLRTRRAWALTGTPLENRADDLVSILDFVAPGRFDRRHMMVGFRRLLAEVQLRRRRADVLADLPPKTVFTIDAGLTPVQRAAYDIAEREGIVWLRALGARVQVSHVLELLLRLKQICNAVPETGESAKLDDLERRIGSVAAAGEKALVFSQFVAEPFGVRAIAQGLSRFAPLVLTGGQDAATRADVLARFAAESRHAVLVLSLRAGGVGLNLTAASVVFHFDRWWTAAVETQAEDRAHRIGQTRPVQVFAYVCGDTVEERIAETIARKQRLFDMFVDGIEIASLARLALADLLHAVGV
jgi:SNF2 family DNA or RNA helicase